MNVMGRLLAGGNSRLAVHGTIILEVLEEKANGGGLFDIKTTEWRNICRKEKSTKTKRRNQHVIKR